MPNGKLAALGQHLEQDCTSGHLRTDVVGRQIEIDTPIATHMAQIQLPIQWSQPSIRVHPQMPRAGKGGNVGKATRGGTLNRKLYLRHVGRDGCVDLDLATYYIGPQLAGRTVLFQVLAESRQFAVWHQDQVVKLLPIKGLVGQEMALSDYLKYIRQEALAASRRSSARRSRKVRQPSLWDEGA